MTISDYILDTAKRIVALHSVDDETAHGNCNCDQCLIACALGTEASENAMLRAKVERLRDAVDELREEKFHLEHTTVDRMDHEAEVERLRRQLDEAVALLRSHHDQSHPIAKTWYDRLHSLLAEIDKEAKL